MPSGDIPNSLAEVIGRAFATAHGRSHDGVVQPGDNTSMYITDLHPLIPPPAPAVPIHDGPGLVGTMRPHPESST